jgi:hypothetical protein
MFKDVLRAIEGVAIYPVIALVLFMVVFVALVIWTARLRREYVDEMGNLPLDRDGGSGDEPEGAPHHG